MMWQHAVLLPDKENEWAWAQEPFAGLPAIVRVLTALCRAGIKDVTLPSEAQFLKAIVKNWSEKKEMPHIRWFSAGGSDNYLTDSTVLFIRGGIVFGPELLKWARESAEDSSQITGCFKSRDHQPLLASLRLNGVDIEELSRFSIEKLCSYNRLTGYVVPNATFCQTTQSSDINRGERTLMANMGKSSELPHVRWIRNFTFPVVRWLAECEVSPNLITWVGFCIGLLGSVFIATGTYWYGVAGAILLCVSWILDNVDGTLARLTFSESTLGEKLDTLLGHLTNIAFFIALVFAVYGRESLLKVTIICGFMVGSITFAYYICKAERSLRREHTIDRQDKRLPVFLDQINGRDFSTLIFLFAVFDGFKFFLWGSLFGIQAFWLLHSWLLYKHNQITRKIFTPSQ